ncbi:hypothetical protein D3C76_154550 [compost metagenome]
MNVNNNKRGSMVKAIKNWITNRIDKCIKIKEIRMFNFETADMKYMAAAIALVAVAWMVHSGVTAYAVSKGVEIHQNVEINIIKKEEPKA